MWLVLERVESVELKRIPSYVRVKNDSVPFKVETSLEILVGPARVGTIFWLDVLNVPTSLVDIGSANSIALQSTAGRVAHDAYQSTFCVDQVRPELSISRSTIF